MFSSLYADVKVHGDVHLEPAVSQDRSDIPAFSSSCLTVDLRELILCKKDEYCNIPISGRVVQRGFTIQRGSFIPYSMDVSEVKPGTYTISAVLNVGWCHHNVRGKRWIQEGDYLNVHGNEVEISNSSTRVRKDIYLTKYKTPDFRKAALEVNQSK